MASRVRMGVHADELLREGNERSLHSHSREDHLSPRKRVHPTAPIRELPHLSAALRPSRFGPHSISLSALLRRSKEHIHYLYFLLHFVWKLSLNSTLKKRSNATAKSTRWPILRRFTSFWMHSQPSAIPHLSAPLASNGTTRPSPHPSAHWTQSSITPNGRRAFAVCSSARSWPSPPRSTRRWSTSLPASRST